MTVFALEQHSRGTWHRSACARCSRSKLSTYGAVGRDKTRRANQGKGVSTFYPETLDSGYVKAHPVGHNPATRRFMTAGVLERYYLHGCSQEGRDSAEGARPDSVRPVTARPADPVT